MKPGHLLLCMALSLVACERVPTSSSSGQGESLNGLSLNPPTNPGPALIQRIAQSRQSTAFQGVRRVEIVANDGGVEHHLVLRERVSADGQGGFAIEAMDLIEPPLDGAERDVFLALQSLRQGVHWRYRDFAIHDAGLFVQNYQLLDTGTTTTVAGLPGLHLLTVERQDQSGPIYQLTVDTATGLVLASREETHEGYLQSQMAFESIQWDFDHDSVAWHQPVNNEQALPTTGSLSTLVGFPGRAPRTLPVGYQLLERTSLVHPQANGLWIKNTYSDGVDTLFFLHGGPIVGGNGIVSGAPPIQADLVEVALAAPWTVATGNLHGERVMALGKVTEQELLQMLSSAME